jgi:CheY-like chemotaxis protein
MAIPADVTTRHRAKAGPFPYSASHVMRIPSDPNAWPSVPADVLVVEDNYFIALDLEALLLDLGVACVRKAKNVPEALDLIAVRSPEFGLIDVNLGEDKCFDIAERLRALGIPFVFTTGYGDTFMFPPHFAEIRILQKPYTVEALSRIFAPEPDSGAR